MYEEITGDYSVNEKDFEAYYSEHKDEILSAYKTNVDSTEPVNDDAVKDYGLEYYTDVMKQDYFNSEYNIFQFQKSEFMNSSSLPVTNIFLSYF